MPMRFNPAQCPECSQPPYGTVDKLMGVALLQAPDASGAVEYSGTTEVCWDSRETLQKKGKHLLICPENHEWWAQKKEVST